MLPLPEAKVLWLDGQLVPWDAGKVHLRSTSVQFGYGVFEGIRSFRQADGSAAIFRLSDHIDRLFDSMRVAAYSIPYDRAALMRACKEVVAANDLQDAYLRPFVYTSEPFVSLAYWLNPPRVAVMAWPWGGPTDGTRDKGVRSKIAAYARPKAHAALFKAKFSGHYLVSVAALGEAVRSGFGQGIFLDEDGFVCESLTENVFLVRGRELWTPPPSRSILLGWTRASVMELGREMGLEVLERDFKVPDLYEADEVFTTGTSSGLTPISGLEDRVIGAGVPGPITQKLQAELDDVTRGRTSRHPEWRHPIDRL